MTEHGIVGDELLVIQAQSAESEAQRRVIFNQLVYQYQGMAHSYAKALLGDLQLAEEATQEAFVTAYRLLPQLRAAQAFPGWLRRILHSHCHRLLKQRKLSTQSLELATELMADQLSPQAILEHLELQEAVRATLEVLPKSQQAPVALYYLGDYSQQEIAEILNLSLAAVKKRLERARYRLAERMRDMAQEYLQSTAQAGALTPDLFTTLLEAAALEGQHVLLEMLFLEGMDVNEQDGNGQTMLHWAAKAGHLGAVEVLLSYQPALNRRDHAGRTALQLAMGNGHSQVAERLRRYAREK